MPPHRVSPRWSRTDSHVLFSGRSGQDTRAELHAIAWRGGHPLPGVRSAIGRFGGGRSVPGKIFVNYRRGDDPGFTQALYHEGWMRQLLLLLLVVWARPAYAATIDVVPQQGDTPALITVIGTLRVEDIEAFQFKTAKISKAVVTLQSDGGSLIAGVRIGTIIRLRNYDTVVPSGARCASACATAWLGGARRFMGKHALVGFHAAYRNDNGQISEHGAGNAVLGAYLNSIGLTEEAIFYVTKAGPHSMTWLTPQEATQRGIAVHLLVDQFGEKAAEDRSPAVPAPSEGPCSSGGISVQVGGGQALCIRPGSGAVFRDCSHCPEMVVVPAGTFTMGSPASERGLNKDEGPQRKVTISRPFAVGKFEMTFTEWEACVAAAGCKHQPDDKGSGRGRRPVINVSWHDAKEYAAWLSRKTGKTYRLLSEAEWEYAARAGTTTPYAFGDTISKSQAQY